MITLDYLCDKCGTKFKPTPPGPGRIDLNRHWKPISGRAVVSHRITLTWTGFRVQAQGRDLDLCPSCWRELAAQMAEKWTDSKSSEYALKPSPLLTSSSR